MEIRRPMELAGLKSRLARAKKTESDIAETGKRYDAVLDQIDEAHGAAKANVGHLEQYASELRSTIEGMVAGDNGAPTDGDQAGPDSAPADRPPYIS